MSEYWPGGGRFRALGECSSRQHCKEGRFAAWTVISKLHGKSRLVTLLAWHHTGCPVYLLPLGAASLVTFDVFQRKGWKSQLACSARTYVYCLMFHFLLCPKKPPRLRRMRYHFLRASFFGFGGVFLDFFFYFNFVLSRRGKRPSLFSSISMNTSTSIENLN